MKDRPFAIAGAWGGAEWVCNCKGVQNPGDKGKCWSCGIQRPSLRHWMKQSAVWGPRLEEERAEVAVRYYRETILSAVCREGTAWLSGEGPGLLAAELSKTRHVSADLFRLENLEAGVALAEVIHLTGGRVHCTTSTESPCRKRKRTQQGTAP